MKKIATILFLLTFSLSVQAQNSYFVATDGNNGNTGSISSPWLTIQYGIDQLSAGDTLSVRAGSYNEILYIEKTGTTDSWITIQTYNNETVTVDGTEKAENELVTIANTKFVIFRGFQLKHLEKNFATGLYLTGLSSDISILNIVISNINFSTNAGDVVNENTNAVGMVVWGDHATTPISNILIDGIEITNCRLGFSEALAVNGNVDGFEISNNYIHDVTNIGIDLIGGEGTSPTASLDQARNGRVHHNLVHGCHSAYGNGAGGIYVDGGKNIVVENNTSYDNDQGYEIGCENKNHSAENITLRNNVAYNNLTLGIAIGGFDFPANTGKVIDAKVYNNTLFNNDTANNYSGEFLLSYSENTIIRNNIIYSTDQNVMVALENGTTTGLDLDYNLYFSPTGSAFFAWPNGVEYDGLAEFQSGQSQETNGQYADPQLTSLVLANPDFHIASTSPAKDLGDPAYVVADGELDFDDQDRIFNDRVDIGADEYSNLNTSVISNPKNIGLIEAYPNPAVDFVQLKLGFNDVNSIEIFDLLGRRVKTLNQQDDRTIDVKNWPAGVYFIRIQTADNQIKQISFVKR